MNGCFQANILAVYAAEPRFYNLTRISGPKPMVWVLSLSDMDVSTHALTPANHVTAFGVWPDLVGGETPASNQ